MAQEIKLKSKTIDEIIEKSRRGESLSSLGKEYKISRSTLGKKLKESGYTPKLKMLSSEDFKSAVKRYNSGEGLENIAKSFSLSRFVLTRMFDDAGIKLNKKYDRLAKTIKPENIVSLYENGESAKDISKDLNVGYNFIREIISKAEITRNRSESNRNTSQKRDCRKYSIDDTVFDLINEESAYWIGFLMADGCVYKSTVGVAIQKRDGEHLEKFREFLKASYPITDKTDNCRFFVMRSEHIVKTLEKFGVVSAKSAIAKIKKLEFNKHFWRGVIDGDGSIYMTKEKNIKISLVGSFDLTNQFLEYIKLFVKTGVRVRPCSNSDKVFRVTLSNRKALQVIRELYNSSGIYLDRKFEIANKIMELYRKIDTTSCWQEKRRMFQKLCYNNFR